MRLKIRKLKNVLILITTMAISTEAIEAHAELRTARPGSPETSRPYGLGAVIGEPYGITSKYWFDRRMAVDTIVGLSFDEYFVAHADFLYHFPDAFEDIFGDTPKFLRDLNPYMGAGIMLLIQTEDTGQKDRTYFRSDQGPAGFAFRFPVGVEWRPPGPVLGVYAEIAPGLGIVPTTYGFVQWGVGVRFYF